MARHSFGEWYGVVTPAGVAVLAATVPLETVERVWRDLRAGNGLGAVIDGLVGAFGTSLSTLPAFGVLSLAESGGVRVAMRGDLEAHLWLSGEAEPVVVSGLGVTTWNERALGGVDRAELVVPGAGDPGLLPVMDGIVRTGRLVVNLVDSDTEPGLPGGRAVVSASATPPASPASPPQFAAPQDLATEAPVAAVPAVPDPSLVAPAASPAVPAPDVPALPDPPVEPDRVPEPEPEAEPTPLDTASSEALAEPAGSRSAETMVATEVPNEYDQLLYGETVLSSVEAAAVRLDEPGATTTGPPDGVPGMIAALPPFPAGTPAVPAVAPVLGDHDGDTVLVEQLHLMQAAQAPGTPVAPVPAREHPRLLVGDRQPVLLDRSAIVGTRPRLSRVQGGNAPHLVTVDSPSGEISRSHVELRVEGFAVLAVDLDSTNGTTLLRVGAEPVRLHPNEPNLLVPGDRIDLGDGVVLRVEGLA